MKTVKETMLEIKKEYDAIFPNSTSRVSIGCLSSGDNGSHSLIVCLGTPEEWGCTSHNDFLRHTFWIHNAHDNDGKLTLESDNKSITIKCSKEESYTQCKRVKTGFRKITNTPENIVISMRKYFEKLHTIILDNKENIDIKWHKFI